MLRRVAAAGEADPRAVQAVCATQWSVCLPLLQRNLRKRVRAELQRVAQALEDINRSPECPAGFLVCGVKSRTCFEKEKVWRISCTTVCIILGQEG